MTFRRPLIAALVLACAAAAGAGGASAAGQPARFGALAIEQVVKDQPGDPGATKLHLRWISADRQADLDLIDDGETMRIEVGAGSCRVVVHYQKYDRRPGEPRLRRRVKGAVADMAEYCRTGTPADRAAWALEYESAQVEFPAAIEEMKRQAYLLFGGDLGRCRQPRVRRSLRTMLNCERRG